MRRNNVTLTSFRRHVPTRFLINQCQIITFLILKSDNIENSRIELKGIVLPVPSNHIKVAFIIILPFNLVHVWFFPVSHWNWRKMWVDYLGRVGGGQGYVGRPLKLLGDACIIRDIMTKFLLVLSEYMCKISCDSPPWWQVTLSILIVWVSPFLVLSVSDTCLHLYFEQKFL